jgi:hypothetical protein
VTHSGQVFVTRDYASLLTVSGPQERYERWCQQTLAITNPGNLRYLAIDGTHVALCMDDRVIFFDTRTLPTLPYVPVPAGQLAATRASDDDEAPLVQLSLHFILLDTPRGGQSAGTSCVQIEGSAVYVTHDLPRSTGVARGARNRCIRRFDFSEAEATHGSCSGDGDTAS